MSANEQPSMDGELGKLIGAHKAIIDQEKAAAQARRDAEASFSAAFDSWCKHTAKPAIEHAAAQLKAAGHEVSLRMPTREIETVKFEFTPQRVHGANRTLPSATLSFECQPVGQKVRVKLEKSGGSRIPNSDQTVTLDELTIGKVNEWVLAVVRSTLPQD